MEFDSSLASSLLNRFAVYHYFLSESPSDKMDGYRQTTHKSLRALEALREVLSSEPAGPTGRTAGLSSKAKKREARIRFTSSSPFAALGVPVPQSRSGAEALSLTILAQLKRTLEVSLCTSIVTQSVSDTWAM